MSSRFIQSTKILRKIKSWRNWWVKIFSCCWYNGAFQNPMREVIVLFCTVLYCQLLSFARTKKINIVIGPGIFPSLRLSITSLLQLPLIILFLSLHSGDCAEFFRFHYYFLITFGAMYGPRDCALTVRILPILYGNCFFFLSNVLGTKWPAGACTVWGMIDRNVQHQLEETIDVWLLPPGEWLCLRI